MIIRGLVLIIKVFLFFLLSAVSLLGCANRYSDFKLDFDTTDDIELSSLSSDINITPIKCASPIDEIYRINEFGDYIFLFGYAGRVIYCVKDDSVISILNASGRGHGEYSRINDFTYDEKTRILYVSGDSKIYKYSVPSMSFIEAIPINYATDGMIVLNSEELLVNCSFYVDETYNKVFRGICLVSTSDGSIKKRCYEMDYYSDFCFITRDLSMCGKDILLSLGGVYKNKIITIDIVGDSINEIDCFSLSSKYKLPKKLVRTLKRDQRSFKDKYRELTTNCKGCHYPAIINSKLVYWCFPKDDNSSRNIVVIRDDKKTYCRSFRISGTNIIVSPDYVNRDRCVAIIEGEAESIITDPNNLSDLGKQIYNTMKAQPFNNPVLLSFTIDKGL